MGRSQISQPERDGHLLDECCFLGDGIDAIDRDIGTADGNDDTRQPGT